MKKLFSILALLVLAVSTRAQLVTATVTITNAPVNTSTLTIQGYTFTWTNGTPVGSFAVLITNTFGGDATNLATAATNAIAQYGITVANSASNAVQFTRTVILGTNYTTNWVSVVLTTNGGSPPTVLVSPIGGGGMTAAQQTNAISQHVLDLNADSTSAIDQTATVASQLVGLTNTQTISGVKLFTGSISGTVSNLTNGTWTNPSFTNGQNHGLAFSSPGAGTESEQFGIGSTATASFSTAVGDFATASGPSGSAFGSNASATNTGDSAFGAFSIATGGDSTAVGQNSTASAPAASAFGYGSTASSANSTAVGWLATTTQTNQVVLGSVSSSVYISGTLLIGGGVSNLTVLGPTTLSATATNALRGTLTIPGYSNSGLVNSNNQDVAISTNSYVQISGPTGAFYIAGIAGGIDGRIVTLENSTGQTMVLGNESGSESTPANRIRTGYGGALTGAVYDRQFTNNPACVTLRYDGAVSRWKVTGAN